MDFGEKPLLNQIRSLNRPSYLWTSLIDQQLAVFLAWIFVRAGIGARTVSVLSALPALLGSLGLLLLAPPWNLITFLVLIQLSYILDCADGPVARVTGVSSEHGAYLDRLLDYLSLSLIGIGYTLYITWQFSGDKLMLWSAIAFFLTRAMSYSAQFLKPEIEGPMTPLSTSWIRRIFGQISDTGLWWFLLPIFVWKSPFWIPLALGASLNFLIYLKGLAQAFARNV